MPDRLPTVTTGCHPIRSLPPADNGVVGGVGDIRVDRARADGLAGRLHAQHAQATGAAELLDLGWALPGAGLLEHVPHRYPLGLDRVRDALEDVHRHAVVVPTEALAGPAAVLGQVYERDGGVAGPGEGDHVLDPRRGEGVEGLEVVDHEGRLTLGGNDQRHRRPGGERLVSRYPADGRQVRAEQVVEAGVGDHPLDPAVAAAVLLDREGEAEQVAAYGVHVGGRLEDLVAPAISHAPTSSAAGGATLGGGLIATCDPE